jgi:hypothetical protein
VPLRSHDVLRGCALIRSSDFLLLLVRFGIALSPSALRSYLERSFIIVAAAGHE